MEEESITGDKPWAQSCPIFQWCCCANGVYTASCVGEAVTQAFSRRSNSWVKKLKLFLARLKKSDLQDPPQAKLVDEAGELCQGLQRSPPRLEKLVQAMAQGRHWGALLTNIQVVRVCVLVHLRKCQYDAARRLLENCRASEKEELVQLWNEVHYHEMMETRHLASLNAVQKYRCRKRHPPPASLCPRGVESRSYSEEVRQTLKRFAREVTAKPSRKQREILAQTTNLQPQCIYNWFANYRRRQARQASRGEEASIMLGTEDAAGHITQAAGGFPEDAGLEPTRLLVASSPGWEQAAGGQGSVGSRALLALPGSGLQSDPLEGFGPSMEPATSHEIQEPAVSYSQTEAKPGTSLSTSPVLQTGWEPTSGTPGLWMQGPAGSPCSWYSFAEGLPASRPAPETAHKAVQCSLWDWDVPCKGSSSMPEGGLNSHLLEGARDMSPGLCVVARSKTVSEQADLEIEGLVLRERQQGSPGPCSAMPSTPWCHPVPPVPSPEECQSFTQEQVLRESTSDSSALDTIWAAWLLCELSSSSRM